MTKAAARVKWSRNEQIAAQGNLFDKMLIHRQQVQDLQEGKGPPLIMIANSLVLCGLPYRPTTATDIVRVAKTGSGTIRVTFHAWATDASGASILMARGSDRTFLHWAVDRAIKSKNRFVPFNAGREFLDDMELTPCGKNYEYLRSTQERLAGLEIYVQRFETGVAPLRQAMPVFERSRLPLSVNPKCEVIDGPMGLLFGDLFFKEVCRRPVPFLLPMLRTLHRKPQMQDLILFLHHRCCHAESLSRVSWSTLRAQLWQEDRTLRRILVRMEEAISLLKAAWPELNAEAKPNGLEIGPPLNGIFMIPRKASLICHYKLPK